jgi:hypothetical protein
MNMKQPQRKIRITRDEFVASVMRADARLTRQDASRLYQQAEHDAGGPEHQKWCAGPDLHVAVGWKPERRVAD